MNFPPPPPPFFFFSADISGNLLELSVLATGQGDEDETIFGVLSQDSNKTIITVFQIPNKSSGQGIHT